MVRTSPWPTMLGTAALLALPVLAAAQTSGTGTQASPTATTQSDTRYPSGTGAATKHLAEANQVLDGIPLNAVTGRNAAKLNQIRRECAALQRSYAANPSTTPGAKSSSRAPTGAAGHWSIQLMALDRDLTALLGPSGSSPETSATGSRIAETGTTGTSGSTASSSRPTGSASKSPSATLDKDVRTKLEEFRTHITQFAAAASGTEPGAEVSAATPPQTGSATGETAQSQTPQTVTGRTSTQAEANAAKQHLTEARQSLADLAALPQAQQLQGEARTQVSQLISQFNQLIMMQADWRSPYDQVNATLTTLLSSPTSSAASSSTTTGATGTSGSAGASGPIALDPAIRGKLEEFRTHVLAFYASAGGDAASATDSTSDEAESHIAAIERILEQVGAVSSAPGSTSSTGSTTGTSGSTNTLTPSGSSVTLTQQQIGQIKMHLQQLRSAIKK